MTKRYHHPVGLISIVKSGLTFGIEIVVYHLFSDGSHAVGSRDGTTHIHGLGDNGLSHKHVAGVGVEGLHHTLAHMVEGIANRCTHLVEHTTNVLCLLRCEHPILRKLGDGSGNVAT